MSGEHDDDNNRAIILHTEEVHQEVVVRTEPHHKPDNVTQTSPSHGPSSEERVHTAPIDTTAHMVVASSPMPRMYGCGQGVKRFRLPEQETGDTPITSYLRTSENNGMY